MLEVAPQDLVPGHIYQIRGRVGTPYSDKVHWGNFSELYYWGHESDDAVFTDVLPPLAHGINGGFFNPVSYTFHQENPDSFARRKSAIMAHARTTQNMTGNPAKPSNYAPLSTNKASGAPKNRRTRRNRKQMSRRK